MYKKYSMALSVFLLLILPFQSITSTQVQLNDVSAEVSVQSISIEISGNNYSTINIYSPQDGIAISALNITWNTSVITLLQFDESVSEFDSLFNHYDNSVGYVRIDAYSFNPSGLTGNITVGRLLFEPAATALAGDMTSLTIASSALWDSNTNLVNNTVFNGTVSIIDDFIDLSTIYVDDDFNETTPGWNITSFNNIQNGINAVATNGMVYVYNGTYYEHVIVNKTITLIGEEKDTTIIDGNNSGYVCTIASNNTILKNFTIQHSGIGRMGIISNGFDNWTIDNCKVCYNGEAGIELHFRFNERCENVTIKNCNISNNDQRGISIYYDSYNNKIYHNTFENNGLHHAYDLGNNQWDNGYPSGGNYWDDYNGTDADNDGIGDIPYDIPGGGNQDQYPLMYQYNEIPTLVTIDKLTIPIGENEITAVNVSYANDLVILSCNLSWDPAVITVDSLDHAMSPFDMLVYNSNPDAGFLRFDGYKFSEVGINGSFTACTLTFSASDDVVDDEWCYVNFTECIIWNSDLETMPTLTQNNIATIQGVYEDINQSIYNRGYPIRQTNDGGWGCSQSFTPTMNVLSSFSIFLGKFGTPEFDLLVELRYGSIDGTIIQSLSIPQDAIKEGKHWLQINIANNNVIPGEKYYIVLPPPLKVNNSFGYEWGYAYGDQYDGGSFWFTRNGGAVWRDLPTMYDFAFKTYGYN